MTSYANGILRGASALHVVHSPGSSRDASQSMPVGLGADSATQSDSAARPSAPRADLSSDLSPEYHRMVERIATERGAGARPTPLDWGAEWMRAELPCLGTGQAAILLMSTITRREHIRAGKDVRPLSVIEARIAQAWDRIVHEWRAERDGEGA